MTQADLAKLAAVATTNIGKVERGAPVSTTTMRAVARALELPAEVVAPFIGEPASSGEPDPLDYPDELEYMNAVYWFLRKSMSHEAVMRGFNMAAAIYHRRQTDRNAPSSEGDNFGRSS
jgi:transcriptional regulator with XRE-family HTH domain